MGGEKMKEYKSNKYIKISAKVGDSKSNLVVPKIVKKVVEANKSKGCSGCSRRSK